MTETRATDAVTHLLGWAVQTKAKIDRMETAMRELQDRVRRLEDEMDEVLGSGEEK